MRIAFISLLLGATGAMAGGAERDAIRVRGELIHPESVTSTADGAVFVGSGRNTIYRATPGAERAEPWVELPLSDRPMVFGVLAHEPSKTLWACVAYDAAASGSSRPPPSRLLAFDLPTGDASGSWPLPGDDATCNDIAVADDGTIYASDVSNNEVVRLSPGGKMLETWAQPHGPAPDDSAIGGIAIVAGRVLVNTSKTGKLLAVTISADGSAGQTTELTLSAPIERPDSMRSVDATTLLLAENTGRGRVSRLVIDGDRVTVTPVAFTARGVNGVTAAGPKQWALVSRGIEDGTRRELHVLDITLR